MTTRGAEFLPAEGELLPSNSMLMSDSFRKKRFRSVSGRLLRAMLAINLLEDGQTTDDWRKLKTGTKSARDLRNVRLFSADQRIAILSAVATDDCLDSPKAITASIHVFRGEDELVVEENDGFEYPTHNGQKSMLHLRGVVGGEGNPAFQRKKEMDCEPELQRLAISPLGYEGKVTEYAFFTKPPRGSLGIINLSVKLADFLESIPISEL